MATSKHIVYCDNHKCETHEIIHANRKCRKCGKKFRNWLPECCAYLEMYWYHSRCRPEDSWF